MYFKIIANTKFISSQKSKELSNETITPYATSDNSLTPFIDRYDARMRLKFNKGCLKQSNKLTYGYGHIVNVYIVYALGTTGSNNNDSTQKNCFFGAVILTKNADIEKQGILIMGSDLIEEEVFHFQVVDLVKMY